jgi:hypothetical protein
MGGYFTATATAAVAVAVAVAASAATVAASPFPLPLPFPCPLLGPGLSFVSSVDDFIGAVVFLSASFFSNASSLAALLLSCVSLSPPAAAPAPL